MGSTPVTAMERQYGLAPDQVIASRACHGANVLTPPHRDPWWKLYLRKFDDPVIRILLISAGLALAIGLTHTPPDWVEGLGIIVAILLSTGLAFWNEYRAERAFDLLNQFSDDALVKVIRAGQVQTVPRRDLVVGDLVLLEQGEETPADGHLLSGVNLQVDEACLTGESVPVAKWLADTQTHSGHAEASQLAYPADRLMRGSLVVDGRGQIEIIAVGDQTELGRTARAAAEIQRDPTPLTRQLERLSKLIGVAGLLFAVLTFGGLVLRGALEGELVLTGPQGIFALLLFVGIWLALSRIWAPIVFDGAKMLGLELRRGPIKRWSDYASFRGWLVSILSGCAVVGLGLFGLWLSGNLADDPTRWLAPGDGEQYLRFFMIAVTIIVVAVPEGLAMSVTLSLAYSMRRMAATNNLVRKMNACETIGATTVICTDKTGTLTQNKMRVQVALFPAMPNLAATVIPAHAMLAPGPWGLLQEAIAGNSTAHLQRSAAGEQQSVGNPTEGALLLWLAEQGVDYLDQRRRFRVTKQWTFSAEWKFMATLGQAPGMGGCILHLKGAPEVLLTRCTRMLSPEGARPIHASERKHIESLLTEHQARGMRTLGFAYHDHPDPHWTDEPLAQVAEDLTWLGFVGIADPLRPEVPEAIAACRRAGVGVKMVTGDNPATAMEIARQIGLWNETDRPEQVVSGRDFEALDEAQAQVVASQVKVLARARPLDKLRLVKLLKMQKQVVAVTGDGMNDAPALNYADVGLAMGLSGSAVAKEASDIILLDDSFKSIVNAILWGRSLYQNIQRFLVFQLTINVSALSIALLGPYLGVAMPLTVMQMLWVNLIMDTFAALALATEPPDEHVMARLPRRPTEFIITPRLARWILGTAAAFVVCLIAMLIYLRQGGPLDYDDAFATKDVHALRNLSRFFAFYVLLNFWNLFNARRIGSERSVFDQPFANGYFWLIAGAILLGQIAITQGLLGQRTFSTYPLSWTDWLVMLSASSLVLWIGEAIRWWDRVRARPS